MLTADLINRSQKIDEAATKVLKKRMSDNIAAWRIFGSGSFNCRI